jgi:hypothetical protein
MFFAEAARHKPGRLGDECGAPTRINKISGASRQEDW